MGYLKWSDNEQLDDPVTFKYFPECMFLMDATMVKTKHRGISKKDYGYKFKKDGLNFNCTIDRKRSLWRHCAGGCGAGSTNDYGLFRQSELFENPDKFFHEKYNKILADRGYPNRDRVVFMKRETHE